MLNQECKTCGKKFHYCSNCDIHWPMAIGYCSDECLYNDPRVKEFEEWFNWLLSIQTDQFYRIVLMESKDELLDCWLFETEG